MIAPPILTMITDGATLLGEVGPERLRGGSPAHRRHAYIGLAAPRATRDMPASQRRDPTPSPRTSKSRLAEVESAGVG